jgi:hypothetical protein
MSSELHKPTLLSGRNRECIEIMSHMGFIVIVRHNMAAPQWSLELWTAFEEEIVDSFIG